MANETQRAAIIGVVTASDRASAGLYEDLSGPAIVAYLTKILKTPFHIVRKIIPDGFESVRDTLIELADKEHCDLILTTGGTGPSPRDLTPEATLAAAPRELPGFGELMRQESSEASANRDPVAADRRASRSLSRDQSARQTGLDRNLPQRGLSGGALLSRSHWRRHT